MQNRLASNPEKQVLIVHAIDTEGPLYESLTAKFDRLRDLYGIDHIAPTYENLTKLQQAEMNLGGGLDKKIAETLSGHLVRFNDTWDKIAAMLAEVMPADFRNQLNDSDGNGWVYNWFCLDHIGYDYNPRRRDIGFHNIFDYYRETIAQYPGCRDGLQWHYHPMSTYQDAHRCATSYFRSDVIFQILARKVIERNWFPSAFRAGFQTERPDSHWFLEQWIPFDISNMALDDNSELDQSSDFRNGRSGNWRQAPADWSVYHPHHDDYQKPGSCRRLIARCLNVLNRIATIDQREMDKAFAHADKGLPTIVGISSHDYRSLKPEVDFLRRLIVESSSKYPGVKFKFCEANEAFRIVQKLMGEEEKEPLELDVRFQPATSSDVPFIEIVAKKGKVFGPQPFLAIETKSRRFLHDNLDFANTPGRWFYAFHNDSIPLSDVRRVGVAANSSGGNTSVKVLNMEEL